MNNKKKITVFESLGDIICDAAQMFAPPERLTVSQAAEEYVKLNNPGQYIGPYRNDQAPYMREPQDECASRIFNALVFVGPAQTGKTQGLILNFAAYSIKVDPMDMVIYSPTQANARDFSMRRVDRMHRHSPEIGAMLTKNADADNKFDKHYSTGMMLTLSWPTVAELAGKPIGRVVITDYDRIEDDIGGDGSAFDLAMKRTTTFRSFAMTVAESSPSREITNPKWVRSSPHEAPPTTGILALYNRGDRRRWYWRCPECEARFEGRWSYMEWDEKANKLDTADTVRMRCPNRGCVILPSQRDAMNLDGRWLKEGQGFDDDDNIVGDEPRSNIASFWLNGTAAAMTTWQQLVVTHLQAQDEYDKTGDEGALTKFYNNDLGEPYLPKSMESERLPEVLASRAEDLGGSQDRPVVPRDVRFLLANVDVGINSFVVQVHGISPGEPFDTTVIDRFTIRKSLRIDDDGDPYFVKPASYLEDWRLLKTLVMERTYPLDDDTGRRMAIKMTTCDSGGPVGATTMAYEFWREMRDEGWGGRFHLTKGDPKSGKPRAQITYPDSSRRDRKAMAQGDVPLLLFNSNLLKDMLSGRLDTLTPGKGLIRFPNWLPDWFYAELCAEVRTDKGWVKQSHQRNEAWDLLYYCLGLCVSSLIRIEAIDWSNPPSWAAGWSVNSLVVENETQTAFPQKPTIKADAFEALGRSLG